MNGEFMRTHFLVAVVLFLGIVQGNITKSTTPNEIKVQKTNITTEQVLKDSLFAVLYPNVFEAITNYYGVRKQFMNEIITEVSHIDENNEKYHFLVRVKLDTFEHAHNPPYGKDFITFEIDLGKVTVTDFKHKGDKWESKISAFKNRVIQDIQKTFGIDFTLYKEFEYGQLLYASEKQKELQSLVEINKQIIEQDLQPKVTGGYKNVLNPFTFIKDNYGYIVYKKSNGTNVVITVKREDGTWTVIRKSNKNGVPMKSELLWYM
ncbi:hypothetical protein BVG16_12960 [Paenibacillus selenitireducens]|uniref:DUF3888 domain-containing protein n=1 Tax=Paenibacillus selenitireducens TaxID=1324314 RepID=A0A1T2XFT2_9BACL|nr:DUF3888 domain-containing protein [Paenibacillus selenitireducens]OPA78744.1 hypothetical protein BVG16_12960 [Paenibacillus selenitireducens]